MLDFTTATAAITAEIGPAIESAMPILGLVLAIGLGVKMYKRFAK